MSQEKHKWVDDVLGRMTLEQKVGQLVVFGFCGTIITPDIVELIGKFHIGGVRVSLGYRIMTLLNDVRPGGEVDETTMESMVPPKGLNRDVSFRKPTAAAMPSEYAAVLNKLRQVALDRDLGIPIHFTVDQEGNASDDMLCRQRLFPHPMGLAASGEPQLAYRVALSIGKQARALGVNMIHSPVLDVNTNPKNPEIGTRSYGDNAETVIKYALQSLKGFLQAGLICTGKHFPGRGESMKDAHWGLPHVEVDRKTLFDVHIAPYRALIKAGLPAVMSAHSCYPALGVTDKPSSMSREILTDLLRGELGFKGVLTTDNMMMGGILRRYEMSEAIVQTLIAGSDIALCRDESPMRIKILGTIKDAIKDGRLPESQVDEKIQRILGMRWDMGLVENGGLVDAAAADESVNDPFVVSTAREAAEKTVHILRDEVNILPLKPEQKILLVEQVLTTHSAANNMYCHPGMLWEQLCELSPNVMSVEVSHVPTEDDKERVRRRLDEDFDVIVATNYYYHKATLAATDVIRGLLQTAKPVVVIATSPYEFSAPKDFPTALICFNPGGKEQLKVVAEMLYGKIKPSATMHVKV